MSQQAIEVTPPRRSPNSILRSFRRSFPEQDYQMVRSHIAMFQAATPDRSGKIRVSFAVILRGLCKRNGRRFEGTLNVLHADLKAPERNPGKHRPASRVPMKTEQREDVKSNADTNEEDESGAKWLRWHNADAAPSTADIRRSMEDWTQEIEKYNCN